MINTLTTSIDPAELPVLRGRALRLILTQEIHEHGSRTVAQLVDTLHTYGFTVGGRPSKTISDALRWEVRRGRVRRPGRGHYVKGNVPPTTMRRIRIFAATCLAWLRGQAGVALRPPGHTESAGSASCRSDTVVIPPTAPPAHPPSCHPPDDQPPWRHPGWIWNV